MARSIFDPPDEEKGDGFGLRRTARPYRRMGAPGTNRAPVGRPAGTTDDMRPMRPPVIAPPAGFAPPEPSPTRRLPPMDVDRRPPVMDVSTDLIGPGRPMRPPVAAGSPAAAVDAGPMRPPVMDPPAFWPGAPPAPRDEELEMGRARRMPMLKGTY